MLDKYGLKPNDAILAEGKHMGLYEDLLQNHNAKLIAGGAAQNTARGAQVRLPIPPSSSHLILAISLTKSSTSFPQNPPSTSAASVKTNTPKSSANATTPPVSAPNT